MKQEALNRINLKQDMLFDLSDSLWDHPETGYHENYAAQRYCDLLTEEGFAVETNLAGIPTAFCGTYGRGGPVVAFLAEFDALPGLSQEADRMVKSPLEPGGAGHGCGHNLLGTGSFAAAIAAKAYLEASGRPGTVKLFGCPAEEGGAGKGFMARDGVFGGVDIAFCWHPGEVNSVSRDLTMANYQIAYHFHGVAAHAAMAPELGRSALDGLEVMNNGVQYLREHIPGDWRVHYAITDTGGHAPGTVQPYASGLYLMRAPDLAQAKELYERVNRIAEGAAMITDTRVEIEFVKACSNMILNTELLRLVQRNMESLPSNVFDSQDYDYAKAVRTTYERRPSYFHMLQRDVQDPGEQQRLEVNSDADIHDIVMPFPVERQGFVSSDVGDVSWNCPLAQINVATYPAGLSMHTWQMVAVGKSHLAKKGMLYAGKVLAASAIDIFEDPDIAQRAQAEFTKRTGGKPFVSPIPGDARPKMA